MFSRPKLSLAVVIVTASVLVVSVVATTPSGAASNVIPRHGKPVPNVKRMLLTLNQMPAGWVQANTSGGGSLMPLCKFKRVAGKPLARARESFGDPSGLPDWGELIDAEPTGKAKPELSAALRELDRCHSFTSPAHDGYPAFTLRLAKASFPTIGDQSEAFAFTGTLEGFQFAYYFVLARFQDVLAIFLYGTLASGGIGTFVKLIDEASAKIESNLQ
jgi:hypothetical protein